MQRTWQLVNILTNNDCITRHVRRPLVILGRTSRGALTYIDPFLGILVAMVFISEVKLRRLVSQLPASLTKLSALLQVMVQFRYNV